MDYWILNAIKLSCLITVRATIECVCVVCWLIIIILYLKEVCKCIQQLCLQEILVYDPQSQFVPVMSDTSSLIHSSHRKKVQLHERTTAGL